MAIGNETYDKLKWVAQYLLPGIGTVYYALAAVWGLPYAEQVVGTLTAIDGFLGVMLGISTSNYKKSEDYGDGKLLIDTSDPAKDIYRLVLNTSLDAIKNKSEVALKVDSNATLNQDE